MGTAKRGRPRTRPVDKGPPHLRLQHARAFLSLNDQMRLEMLINTPPIKLVEEGKIDLPKAKRLRTSAEEREAAERAAREEQEALFAKAENAPFNSQRKDPIGRAWYEGLLEGHGIDSSVLREIGREYAGLYWGELRTLNASVGLYDESLGRPDEKRTFQMKGLTGKELARFEKFERTLAPLGREVRICLQKLCTDDMWFLTGPEWLDRCISTRRAERRAKGEPCEPPVGPGATAIDARTLAHAVVGLKALILGVSR